MDARKEIINILKAELTLLSKNILQNIHQKDIDDLYQATQRLYEKMAAVKVLQEQMPIEELSALFSIPPKDLEQDMPPVNPAEQKPEKQVSNPYKSVNKMAFVPKHKTEKTSKEINPLNEVSVVKKQKKINIGLNDRIAFIKHLFKGDTAAYQTFIDALNAFESYEAALAFINQQIKPQYNGWEGQDEYEFRLLQLLELKFAQ